MNLNDFELVFVFVLLPLFPIGLLMIVLKTLLEPSGKAKSGKRLIKTNFQSFISYKSLPDERTALHIREFLEKRSIPVIMIHGDTECPYPFGSWRANRWIKKKLSNVVSDTSSLIVVFSNDTLASRWVRHEVVVGSSECDIIVFIPVNGAVMPQDYLKLKYLPSCPIYSFATGDDTNKLVDFIGAIVDNRKKQVVRRLWVSFLMIFLWIIPGIAFISLGPGVIKGLVLIAWSLSIYIIIAISQIVMPAKIDVAKISVSSEAVCIKKGFSFYRVITFVAMVVGVLSSIVIHLFPINVPFVGIIIPSVAALVVSWLIKITFDYQLVRSV